MNYEYPIEETWSTNDIIDVTDFFNLIEKAYESKVDRKELLESYRKFKKIVPAKNEENHYFREFERSSTYSSYQVMKLARKSTDLMISLK